MNTEAVQGYDVHKVGYEGKMCMFVLKPLLLITLPWPVTARLVKKRITPVDTFFELRTNEKCWSSLLTVADGHPVVDIGYSPHNISYDTSLLFYIANEVKDWCSYIFTHFLYKSYLLTKYVICSSYLLLFHCL